MRYSFILLWLISVIILVLTAQHIKNSQLTSHLESQVKILEDGYLASVNHFEETANMVYRRHVLKTDVLDEMWVAMNADENLRGMIRSEIYHKLKKPYEEFVHIGVKQFHFHFPKAISFLRMHRPGKYGDDLSAVRYSIVRTNEKKLKSIGFEEGRIYNGFRYVYPLYFRDIFIGTVEVGMSSQRIINILDNLFKGQHQFFISQKIVNEKVFKDERFNYEESFLDSYYKEGKSQQKMELYQKVPVRIIDQLGQGIKDQANQHVKDKKAFSVFTQYKGTTYVASFYPIQNVKGDQVAYISRYKVDSRVPEIFVYYRTTLFVGFVVCTLIWILIYLILRFWKQKDTINHLLQKEIKDADEKLEIQEQMLVQQSKMATIGEMLGAIAHQWKQPLNRLGLMIQSLDFEVPDESQKGWDLDGFIDHGMKEIHFMGDTVTDFMRFIRPNEGSATCIIRNQIKDVVALVKPSIEKEHIELSFEINDKSDEPLIATCHGNDLNHILINLITNARDAILKKRKTAPKDYRGTISVSLTNQLDCVWISVSDDGGGIPSEIQEKIFEAHFTTKSEKTGSGIGLYVIKRIVEERANGFIEIVNNNQGGATFTITLSK